MQCERLILTDRVYSSKRIEAQLKTLGEKNEAKKMEVRLLFCPIHPL